MELFIKLMPVCSGLFLIVSSLLLRTKNFQSAFYFKILPMLLGLGSLFSGLKLFGWI